MYNRIMLKLSGEALSGEKGVVDQSIVNAICAEIKRCVDMGVQVTIVVGGGNIWRGRSGSKDMDRGKSDNIGMLATVINSLILQASLEELGVASRVQTAVEMKEIAEPYISNKAKKQLEDGNVILFAAGLGIPYVSTDTAAVLRAIEMSVDAIFCAKNIDGVYNSDPKTNGIATKYDSITPTEILASGLSVMDATAVALCREYHVPIHLFGLDDVKNISRVLMGENIGTYISE